MRMYGSAMLCVDVSENTFTFQYSWSRQWDVQTCDHSIYFVGCIDQMHLFRSDDDDNEFERRQCRRRWEDARQTVYWLLYENSILTAGADKTIVGRLHAIQCFKLLPTTTTENTAQFHLMNILSLKASTSSERAWALLILTQPNPTNICVHA